MKKLNKKGFAISSIIYAMVILFLVLLTSIMAMLTRRKMAFDKSRNEIKDNLSFNNKTFSFNESNDQQIFDVVKTGYYKLELWGKQMPGSSNGGSYAQVIMRLNQSDNLFIALNAQNSGKAIISTITHPIMEAGNSSIVRSTIYTNPDTNTNNLVCYRDGSNNMKCDPMSITVSNMIAPTIILSGDHMPYYNGYDAIPGNKPAHAKITYLTDKTPEVATIKTTIANSYNNTTLSTIGNIGIQTPNGFKISGGNTAYKINIPDKGFAFTVRTTNTLTFGNGVTTENITGNRNYVTASAGTITIPSGATVIFENITYNGQSVKTLYGNESLESIPPIVRKGCSNIASSTAGCSIPDGSITGKAFVIINRTNTSSSSQIKINNGEWQDMTKKSNYDYIELSEPGTYRIYTRQKYTNANLTNVLNPYYSETSSELVFTIN